MGIGQPDSVVKSGIGDLVGGGRGGEVLEDDYGIAVEAETFLDIVTGVDPSKFVGKSGRIGEEVMRRGLGFGTDGKQVADAGTTGAGELVSGKYELMHRGCLAALFVPRFLKRKGLR